MDQTIEDVWQSRELIEQIQARRLAEMLEAIIPRNRFYTSKFEAAGVDVASVKTLEDLRKLPLTTKQELVDSQTQQPPYGANLSYPSTSYTRLHQTSGTTGRPMRWMDTAASWDWIMECWRQIYLLAGLTKHDRLFFPFSFGPFIGFWAAFEGASRLGNFVIAGGGMSTEIRLHAMIENEATVVCCTPTYALRMAEVAAQEGIDLKESSVRMLIVAGEPGGAIPATRTRIESAWDARVIDHWGMTEIASLGVESEDRPGGMYLLETEMIAEIVDPETLEPVAPGEVGELLITNLGRLGSPLIRYRTRDLVQASTDEDPSGRKLQWLAGGILGRSDDMVTVRGNNVFPSSVEAVLREIDAVAEFRIDVKTVRAMHELCITVEPTTEAEAEGLQNVVKASLRKRLGFACEVALADPGELPRFELKGRRFHRET
ncbi:phenylacetate--CoA ligase family protein [Fuerstiella marisgermanici]|uniref:Phenylacetate-coenzyme A ligase n=1 Tax=Fuerstiella marisgermanici TaxID=1891926 RepID=A0A1P8W9X7_9PLAN|nr:AMP-binding protein [Fuerstiella marisgermanici]APZ90863.1 Phenylacetate-coenzyme A ligase [Fuerstiella marisgermanici]